MADVDQALFEDRILLRTLAMRRTLFVPTVGTAADVEASSSVDVAAQERRRLEQYIDATGIADPVDWLGGLADTVLDALGTAEADGLSARELTAAVPELATRILMGRGTKHAVEAGATSRVLGLMAVEGHLVRGRPAGNWTGRQYRWHRRDRWWSSGDGPATADRGPEAAAHGLLTRWLARFGPATVTDMKWWTGWTMTKTRKILAGLDTVEVELAPPSGDGEPTVGHLLADDVGPVAAPEPWAALLPALDPTPMGWKERDWYLGSHAGPLFDRNGNIGPTVWVDGRIVGCWSQNPDGEVVTHLLEDVDADRRRLIETEVERMAAFIGSVIVKPSFPTPLQKQLSLGEQPGDDGASG